MALRCERPYRHTRALVRRLHDRLVRFALSPTPALLTPASILIPWVTLRQVPVEVEIVSNLLTRP
jgi:hypothetical protein